MWEVVLLGIGFRRVFPQTVAAYRKDAEVLIEESHFAVQSEWVTFAPLTSVSSRFFQAEIRSYASDATSGHWLRTAMDGTPLLTLLILQRLLPMSTMGW